MRKETFGEYVKKLRGERTKKEIADRGGFTPEYIRRIEEINKIPSQEIIVKLASALGASEKDLLFRALQEKAPSFAKSYYDPHNIERHFGEASKPSDILNPGKDAPMLSGAREILKAFRFMIEGTFLEPLAKPGQTILVSYVNQVRKGEYMILEVGSDNTDFAKELVKFQTANGHFVGVTDNQLNPVVGKVIDEDADSFTLSGIADKASKITIPKKNVQQRKIQIMGVLFS